MDIARACLNEFTSSEVYYIYFDAAVGAILYELISVYKMFLIKDVRKLMKLNMELYFCIKSAKLWYQPYSEKGCWFTRGFYVGDLLVLWKAAVTIARVIEAIKSKYHDDQEHTGVKHSYLEMFSDMPVVGLRHNYYAYVHRECVKEFCCDRLE